MYLYESIFSCRKGREGQFLGKDLLKKISSSRYKLLRWVIFCKKIKEKESYYYNKNNVCI